MTYKTMRTMHKLQSCSLHSTPCYRLPPSLAKPKHQGANNCSVWHFDLEGLRQVQNYVSYAAVICNMKAHQHNTAI